MLQQYNLLTVVDKLTRTQISCSHQSFRESCKCLIQIIKDIAVPVKAGPKAIAPENLLGKGTC